MFVKQMRLWKGDFKGFNLALIAVLVLLSAFIIVGPAQALNGPGNKAANFLGYEYIDSHNIKVFTDKGNSNPPKEAVRIFRGSGVDGERLTVDTTYAGTDIDIATGSTAYTSSKTTVTNIRTVEAFEPGQLYTVLISSAVRGNNALPLSFFYFNKDIMFTFEVPDASGNYSSPVSIISRPENGATMVPWEGNIGFTVSQAVYNHEEVKDNLVLKKNGTSLVLGSDIYNPIDGYPHCFFYFPMTGSGAATSFDLSASSDYTLIIPPIKGADGGVLLGEQSITFSTTGEDLPDCFIHEPVVAASAGILNVSWETVSGATGYNVYASEDPYFDFVKLNASPVTETSYETAFADVGLDAAKSYFIRVTPVNGGGEGGFSLYTSTDPDAPEWSAESTVTIGNVAKNSLTLNWTAATDNSGAVDSYRIYRNGVLLDSVAGTSPTYDATGLAANTAYVFKIEAGDAAGNWTSNGPSITALTALPLVWDAATDNIAVTKYRLYQGDSLIATTIYDQRNWEVTGLSPGVSYTFTVQAGDAIGNWSSGNPILEATAGAEPDFTPPTWTYGSLEESNVTQTSLTLSWSGASDDKGVAAYRVYQSGSVIATVYDATTYSVTGLTAASSYTFTVEAGDAAGYWSDDGPSRTVTTAVADPGTVATPSASPGSGALVAGTLVTLTTSTSGATIYYTLDGSTPSTGSTAYSGPFAINEALTLKAIAFKDGMTGSGVLTAAYTIQTGGVLTGAYAVTPAADAAYTSDETTDGIDTMTVKAGYSGSRSFTVNVSSVTAHSGTEKAVFVQLRNGQQASLQAVAADFDTVNTASASFEVQPGDIVKVFIVDDLYTTTDTISTVLEQ